jgi:hypothetical protein
MSKFPSSSCNAVALGRLERQSWRAAKHARSLHCFQGPRNLQQIADAAFEFSFQGRALEASLLPQPMKWQEHARRFALRKISAIVGLSGALLVLVINILYSLLHLWGE